MWKSGTATQTEPPIVPSRPAMRARASAVRARCEMHTALGADVVPLVKMMKAVSTSSFGWRWSARPYEAFVAP